MSIDQASAALIGAVIGASAGLLGSFLTGWRQSRLEKDKWQRTRDDTVRTDTRTAVAQLAKSLASCAHSIMWATYKPLNSLDATAEDLSRFEQEIHTTIADLVSHQTLIATLDKTLHEKVTPLVSEAISLSGETFMTLNLAVVSEDVETAWSELSSCNSQALEFIKRVPVALADLLHS